MWTRVWMVLLMGVSSGSSACGSRSAAPPAPCPSQWSPASPSSLARVTAELAPLEPQALDTCVAGFMGGALVARFEARPARSITFVGEPMPNPQSSRLLDALRTALPERVGTTTWTAIASGRQTVGDNVEQRVLFEGPAGTYLYVFEWSG